MKELELENIKKDLYQYLRNKNALFSPEFSKVVADATRFTTAVVRQGFETSFADSPARVSVHPDRPFIELAEALVDHQIRFVRQKDREMVEKSLLEAYTHVAGPRYVFESPRKTRFVHSLRRSGPKKFAALLFSLHLYNLICALIRDDLRMRISDVRCFELYLQNVEAMCRDIVNNAVKVPTTEIDEAWASAVMASIVRQLHHPPSVPAKSQDLSVPSGFRR